jgi:hypothetical protein
VQLPGCRIVDWKLLQDMLIICSSSSRRRRRALGTSTDDAFHDQYQQDCRHNLVRHPVEQSKSRNFRGSSSSSIEIVRLDVGLLKERQQDLSLIQ